MSDDDGFDEIAELQDSIMSTYEIEELEQIVEKGMQAVEICEAYPVNILHKKAFQDLVCSANTLMMLLDEYWELRDQMPSREEMVEQLKEQMDKVVKQDKKKKIGKKAGELIQFPGKKNKKEDEEKD